MISAAKTRILDAAEDLFANKGYGATSIVDIAAAVGIRGPAIYKHYSRCLQCRRRALVYANAGVYAGVCHIA